MFIFTRLKRCRQSKAALTVSASICPTSGCETGVSSAGADILKKQRRRKLSTSIKHDGDYYIEIQHACREYVDKSQRSYCSLESSRPPFSWFLHASRPVSSTIIRHKRTQMPMLCIWRQSAKCISESSMSCDRPAKDSKARHFLPQVRLTEFLDGAKRFKQRRPTNPSPA